MLLPGIQGDKRKVSLALLLIRSPSGELLHPVSRENTPSILRYDMSILFSFDAFSFLSTNLAILGKTVKGLGE